MRYRLIMSVNKLFTGWVQRVTVSFADKQKHCWAKTGLRQHCSDIWARKGWHEGETCEFSLKNKNTCKGQSGTTVFLMTFVLIPGMRVAAWNNSFKMFWCKSSFKPCTVMVLSVMFSLAFTSGLWEYLSTSHSVALGWVWWVNTA